MMLYAPLIHIAWDGRGVVNVEPVPSKIPSRFIPACQRFAEEFRDRIERMRGEALLSNEVPLPIKHTAADVRGLVEHVTGERLTLVFRWTEPRGGICECGHQLECHHDYYGCRPIGWRPLLNPSPPDCPCREFRQAPALDRFEMCA